MIDLNPQRIAELVGELWSDEKWVELFEFVIVYLLASGSLFAAFWLKNPVFRYIILLGWLPLIWTNMNFRLITGYEFMYSDAALTLNHIHMMPAAVSNFKSPLLISALISAGTIIFIIVLVQKTTFRIDSRWVYLMPLAFGMVLWQISKTNGVVCQFPSFYRIPMCLGYAFVDDIYPTQRDSVIYEPIQTGVKHLVFIIDESITGDKLSLNGDSVNTTPYLLSKKHLLINFGNACAITNFSAGSNALLLTGIRVENLPDIEKTALKSPTLFQFAKKAGYSTYYIDAQMVGPGLQNYMSINDLPFIDHFVRIADSLPRKRYFERDMEVVNWIHKISKSKEKTFIVINKAGAHWPYGRTFPKDSAVFKPFVQRNAMVKDPNRTRNAYYNSIRWTVDTFWKRLIKKIKRKDSTLIVYTSDHGQDLSGSGNQISHATVVNTKMSEVTVPLWIYDKTHYVPKNFKPLQTTYSHQQIFPSLLLWMGYEQNLVKSKYGTGLLDTIETSTPEFWVGDIFGRGVCKKIRFKEENF